MALDRTPCAKVEAEACPIVGAKRASCCPWSSGWLRGIFGSRSDAPLDQRLDGRIVRIREALCRVGGSLVIFDWRLTGAPLFWLSAALYPYKVSRFFHHDRSGCCDFGEVIHDRRGYSLWQAKRCFRFPLRHLNRPAGHTSFGGPTTITPTESMFVGSRFSRLLYNSSGECRWCFLLAER